MTSSVHCFKFLFLIFLVSQVPVCPLCSQPVPVSRGSVPDHAVSQHIENNCETRKKAKVFSNKCNKAKCKKKELVPLTCGVCKLNFCLTHRHPADHDCQGPPDNRGRAVAAASASASGLVGLKDAEARV